VPDAPCGATTTHRLSGPLRVSSTSRKPSFSVKNAMRLVVLLHQELPRARSPAASPIMADDVRGLSRAVL